MSGIAWRGWHLLVAAANTRVKRELAARHRQYRANQHAWHASYITRNLWESSHKDACDAEGNAVRDGNANSNSNGSGKPHICKGNADSYSANEQLYVLV
ncbi:hypothetical protein KSX_59340 [Ktedonospora formicarum]|uniref:Uncharacterized protein n=1 Tax=Ktedonospora formicarum TaxID=2778364 RepID=A0A8J3MVB4_9CHLR|nr:hypothetical protein KSX_59340 [Ktedonospora formicarum]